MEQFRRRQHLSASDSEGLRVALNVECGTLFRLDCRSDGYRAAAQKGDEHMSNYPRVISESVVAELGQRYGHLLGTATIRDVCHRSVEDLTGWVATHETVPEMATRLAALRLDRLGQQQPQPGRNTQP
jgi:hypothetical protein